MGSRSEWVVVTKKTEQRQAIKAVLANAGRPLSVQEVLESAQGVVPGLGIATVYRNLKALAEEGWLQVVELPGAPGRYELADQHHHHHFHCDGCDRVFDVPGCHEPLEADSPAGFQVRRHEVLLYGRCADCVGAA